MTARQIRSRLVGRTITRVVLHPFDNGRLGTVTDPCITLDDGTELKFVVQETEGSEYGVSLVLTSNNVGFMGGWYEPPKKRKKL